MYTWQISVCIYYSEFLYRHSKYLEMVCNGVILPEKLPPSERAAHFHGFRVHLQVIIWKMLDDESQLDPTEWGWKSHNGHLLPIAADNEIAPAELLKVIRCKCKMTSKNPCGANTCTCRKNGLRCMSWRRLQ